MRTLLVIEAPSILGIYRQVCISSIGLERVTNLFVLDTQLPFTVYFSNCNDLGNIKPVNLPVNLTLYFKTWPSVANLYY